MGFTTPTNASLASAVAGPRSTTAVGRQLAELAGSGTEANDWFGDSVAVAGSTILVGASAEPRTYSSVGRAYVFTKMATGWRQTATLEDPDILAYDWFGDAVAVSGRTIVIGAPAESIISTGVGWAYVFTKTATGWHRTVELEGPDPVAADLFGVSVAVSGRTIVIGAPGQASKAGAVYVFTNAGTGWRATELKGSDTVAKDDFGDAVAVSGGTIVVGAFAHASVAGRAYVFTRGAGGWHEAAELAGSDTIAGDGFGVSVAVAGTTLVVGAGLAASDAGRAYVFTKTALGWRQSAELAGSDTVANDGFGDSVAATSGTIVVGAFAHASSAGRAYVFTKTATGWHQSAELVGSDTVEGDQFGYSVAVAGSTIVAGATRHASAGRAYVFEAFKQA
jgi:drug/metabolite transporter superfamily protein YnfA